MKLEWDKEYKLQDSTHPLEISCVQVSQGQWICVILPDEPHVIVTPKTHLIFCGKSTCLTSSGGVKVCVFDVKGAYRQRIAMAEGFENSFVEITEEVVKEEDHTGQIYNPFTDSWSWI